MTGQAKPKKKVAEITVISLDRNRQIVYLSLRVRAKHADGSFKWQLLPTLGLNVGDKMAVFDQTDERPKRVKA